MPEGVVVVFDINVLVSGLIARGKPRELWLKAVRKEFTNKFSTARCTLLLSRCDQKRTVS